MLSLLPAQPPDAPLLKAIAIAAKSHWGYLPQRMAQFAQSSIITLESIANNIVYKACMDAAPAGWYRLLPQTPVAILDDLWVAPAFMGHGIGRALFQHAVAQAQARGAQALELDADPNAAPFYERMGCSTIGQSLSDWGRQIPRMRYSLNTHP